MALRQIKYSRILAFFTLMLCTPINVWAAGPFVWCMGPHDHAMIENVSTQSHHGGHHHDIDFNNSNDDVLSHDNGENDVGDCIDLKLGHDGTLNSIENMSFQPCLVDVPRHFDVALQPLLADPRILTRLNAPPDIQATPPPSLLIKSTIVLLI